MISCKYIWYIPSGKTSVEKHESKTADIHETKEWYAIITHVWIHNSQKYKAIIAIYSRLRNEGHYHIPCQQIQASHLGVFCKRTYLEATFLLTESHVLCTKPINSIPEENGVKELSSIFQFSHLHYLILGI